MICEVAGSRQAVTTWVELQDVSVIARRYPARRKTGRPSVCFMRRINQTGGANAIVFRAE